MQRFLGEGAKKRVYLAHDTRLDSEVAIAVLKTEALDPEGLDRVRRETQAMGRLRDHPHIVTIHDIGEEDGRTYIVQEYMEGGSLEKTLREAENHQLPPDDALRFADQICQALEHAHERGIIHRDLSPGNVAFSQDGTVKLGDFGLAVVSDQSRLTTEGLMVGTALYMPPEQASGRDSDARSDLYSLGCVLYEMLAGAPPFEGDDTVAVISQHLNTAPILPSWRNSEVTPALDSLIMELLAKAPDERPATARSVRERLEQIANAPPEPVEVAQAPTPRLGRLAWGRFVGRPDELGTLKSAVDTTMSGQGSLVMVVGEPGIGKTRIAEEAGVYARLRGMQLLVGRCHEAEAAFPYFPFVEAMRQYVADRPTDALQEDLGAGASDVAKLVSEIRERLPNLPESPQIEPEQERHRLFESVSYFLLRAAKANPLLLLLDDIHWADKPSLLLLQHLVRRLKGSRLLVIGTYRDVELDRRHPLSEVLAELRRERLYERVLLRGLSADEVTGMMESIAQHELDAAGRALAQILYQETEGNPFFVEETLRDLAETGAIYQRDGRWTSDATSIEELGVPEGVREVIGRRLSRLSEECNHALAYASVLGREFDFAVLGRMAELDEEALLSVIEEALQHQAIIEVRGRSAPTYSFWHALVRGMLYDELSLPRKQRLHLQAAEAIENTYGKSLERSLSSLAVHYRHAGAAADAHKVLDYSLRAGERAAAIFAYEEATEHWTAALELMEESGIEPERRARLLEQLGDLMYVTGLDLEKGLDYREEALRLYEASGQEERAAQAHSHLGRQLSTFPASMDIPRALEHFRAAERVLGRGPERAPLGHLYTGIAAAAMYGNRTEEGLAAASRALQIAESLENESLWAIAALLKGVHLHNAGALEEGLILIERAWETANRLDLPMIGFLAVSLRAGRSLGDYQDAKNWYERELANPHLAQAPIQQSGLRRGLIGAHASAGELAKARQCAAEWDVGDSNDLAWWGGDWERVEALNSQGLERARQTGQRAIEFDCNAYLALHFRILNEHARAEEYYEAMLAIANDGTNVLMQMVTSWALAIWCAETGRSEEAHQHLEHGREILASGEDFRVVAGRFSAAEGVVAASEGRLGEATAHFNQAIDTFRRYSSPFDETMVLVEWAGALAAGGKSAEAVAKLDDTLEIYRRVEAGAFWLERVVALKMELQGAASTDVKTSIDAVAATVQAERPDLRPHAAPDGTVTILFSDIESHTAINERLGDQRWMELLREHNALIRDQIQSHEGYEVKTEGDGFMVAFQSARKAVQCAIAMQRAFANRNDDTDESVLVRIGLHTGEPVKENNDFYGTQVTQAARIGNEANGGEILVSALLKQLTEAGGDIAFSKARDVELKDLGRQQVFGVVWDPA